jgi:hypothetical protein
LLATVPAGAQPVAIYSEFQRIDPYGVIVATDRSWRPREILSPAVARNGHAVFHVAVTTPPGEPYLLFVVTNPAEAARVTVYREQFVQGVNGWIPDLLRPVTLPESAVIPDPEQKIEGQSARVYLLDVFIPTDAQPGRFRLEVQLKRSEWSIYPLEFRVTPATYPELSLTGVPAELPSPDAPADAFAAQALLESWALPPLDTVRAMLYRNAQQDAALARSRRERLLNRALENFRSPLRPWGAEWYLRLRDSLLK